MICVVDGADASRFPFLFKAARQIYAKGGVSAIAADMLPLLDLQSAMAQRAVHQFCLTDDERVVGYQCLMSTLRPTLRGADFATLCEGPPPRAADIYELSGRCIDRTCHDGEHVISSVAGEMTAGLIEWGLAHGISRILLETDLSWVLRAMQLRFHVRPLGPPKMAGTRQLLAVELTFDPRTLAAVRDYRGDHACVAYFDRSPSEPARRRIYAS